MNNIAIDQLIVQAQSSDNTQREAAENQLLQACDTNASQTFHVLMVVAMDANHDQSSRQFALLTLRKFITFYWGPGFDSYRNSSNIDEQTKEFTRDCLVKLCLDNNIDVKIKNSASYCVVQISAGDFPDQWPQLLTILYEAIAQQHSLNAMSLLNEIYDDVISEEMFFEGGIGYETLTLVFQLLVTPESTLEAKVAATKLFHAALLQMSTVDTHSSIKRKAFIDECVPKALETLGNLLVNYSNVNNLLETTLIGRIYENLILMKNEFPKKLFPKHLKDLFKTQVFKNLQNLRIQYEFLLSKSDDSNVEDKFESVNECSIFVIEFLTSISDSHFNVEEQSIIIDSFISLCRLDPETEQSWTLDFNDFVSKETGLLPTYTIRDQINEFFLTLHEDQLVVYFQLIAQKIVTSLTNKENGGSNVNESMIYLMQSLLMNEDDIKMDNFQDLLLFLNTIFDYQTRDAFLKGRIFLTIPKFLDKFMDVIPNVKELVQNFISRIIGLTLQSDDDLIRSCTLISFTYFTYFAELPSVLGTEQCRLVQENILKITNEVLDDSEEDTLGLLVEVINQVISCNTSTEENGTLDKILQSEFHLVLTISGKDPSNIQIVVESQECLEKLLEGINTATYNSYVELCLPSFINIINGNKLTDYKYSPLLSLILEFVTIFMKKKPSDGYLPAEIGNYLFEPLVDVLRESSEDETIQLATDAFSYLIYNTDTSKMVPKLEVIVNVLERLLSLNVTDTAAMNVGTLIVTIFSKFSIEIQSLIPVILRAAVGRLIQSKNISTQQNLVSLLCFLTCSDPKQTVDFLFELNNENGSQDIVTHVLQKWFESFEIIRGEKRIKENIIALTKLYILGDDRIGNIEVNGDLIPYDGDLIITRSMAKKMPDRYTQISSYQKIVKLFVTELGFQNKQPSANDFTAKKIASELNDNDVADNMEENNDDGGWEDVDDVLEYDKLKEYIDDEDPAEYGEDDSEEITGMGDIKQSVSELLKEALREFAGGNINNFQELYNQLSDLEKTTLSEQLV